MGHRRPHGAQALPPRFARREELPDDLVPRCREDRRRGGDEDVLEAPRGLHELPDALPEAGRASRRQVLGPRCRGSGVRVRRPARHQPGHDEVRRDDRPHRGLRRLRSRQHLHGRRARLRDGSDGEGRPEAHGPRRPQAQVERRRHLHGDDPQDRLPGRKGRKAHGQGREEDVQGDRQGLRGLRQSP